MWFIIIIGIIAFIWWANRDQKAPNPPPSTHKPADEESSGRKGDVFAKPSQQKQSTLAEPKQKKEITIVDSHDVVTSHNITTTDEPPYIQSCPAVTQEPQATTSKEEIFTGFELWKAFYHMTHYNNLAGILNHGILSWSKAHGQGYTQADISDHSVQRWRNRLEPVYNRSIHDYAPLYINPKNPMLYVRRNLQHELVILKISAGILNKHQHVFTDGNAASRGTKFSADNNKVTADSNAALRATRWTDIPDGKRRRCAEVLVYPAVEPQFIINAICSNEHLRNMIKSKHNIPVVIDRHLFF